MPAPDVIPEEQLQAFFDDISANDGSSLHNYGMELEFFERNQFHWSVGNQLYESIPYYLDRHEALNNHHIFHGRHEEPGVAMAFAIRFRNRLRARFGIAPLSPDELEHFAFELPDLPHAQRYYENRGLRDDPLGDPVYWPTEDEKRRAADYIRAHYPEATAYLRALDDLAPQQGYRRGDVGGPLWSVYVKEGLCAVIDTPEQYLTITRTHDVLKYLRS